MNLKYVTDLTKVTELKGENIYLTLATKNAGEYLNVTKKDYKCVEGVAICMTTLYTNLVYVFEVKTYEDINENIKHFFETEKFTVLHLSYEDNIFSSWGIDLNIVNNLEVAFACVRNVSLFLNDTITKVSYMDSLRQSIDTTGLTCGIEDELNIMKKIHIRLRYDLKHLDVLYKDAINQVRLFNQIKYRGILHSISDDARLEINKDLNIRINELVVKLKNEHGYDITDMYLNNEVKPASQVALRERLIGFLKLTVNPRMPCTAVEPLAYIDSQGRLIEFLNLKVNPRMPYTTLIKALHTEYELISSEFMSLLLKLDRLTKDLQNNRRKRVLRIIIKTKGLGYNIDDYHILPKEYYKYIATNPKKSYFIQVTALNFESVVSNGLKFHIDTSHENLRVRRAMEELGKTESELTDEDMDNFRNKFFNDYLATKHDRYKSIYDVSREFLLPYTAKVYEAIKNKNIKLHSYWAETMTFEVSNSINPYRAMKLILDVLDTTDQLGFRLWKGCSIGNTYEELEINMFSTPFIKTQLKARDYKIPYDFIEKQFSSIKQEKLVNVVRDVLKDVEEYNKAK